MYGGSYTASLVMGSPRAAASRASTAPEECPKTKGAPPTCLISASRSSISRSTAYGRVSPLAPASTPVVREHGEVGGEHFGEGPRRPPIAEGADHDDQRLPVAEPVERDRRCRRTIEPIRVTTCGSSTFVLLWLLSTTYDCALMQNSSRRRQVYRS